MFDEVRIVLTGHFNKFLKMVIWLSCLSLEVTLDGRNILLVRVVCFLVVVVAAGNDCDPSGASLFSLLATFSALPSAFDSGFECFRLASTSSCFPIAWREGSPNRLLARGMPSGDIKQLHGGA
jgi:hypothetical protein